MSGNTFAEALVELNAGIAREAARKSFNLIIEGVFVTRIEGGGYIAYVNGKTYAAVSDGATGVGEDGKYHFSLEDNPLG